MLVINPDECIDCGVCVPECPVDAIIEDTEDIGDKWYKLNDEYAQKWPQITKKKDAYPEAKKYAEEENKLEKYGLEEE